MTINTRTATIEDIKAAETSELLRVYNKIMNKEVKKFATRANAESQTWKAIGTLPPGFDIDKDDLDKLAPEKKTASPKKAPAPKKVEKLTPKKKAAAPAKEKTKRKASFRFAPLKEQKTARQGSLRAKVYDMICQKNGALMSEISKATGWTDKTLYEGLRLVHFRTGIGMWHEEEGNDIRIVAVINHDEYVKLLNESKKKAA